MSGGEQWVSIREVYNNIWTRILQQTQQVLCTTTVKLCNKVRADDMTRCQGGRGEGERGDGA